MSESFRSDADEGRLAKLQELVNDFNKKYDTVGVTAVPHTNAPPETLREDPSRTLARPQFSDQADDRPMDVGKRVLPSVVMTVEDFEAQKERLDLRCFHDFFWRPIAECAPASNASLALVMTSDFEVWVLNRSAEVDVEMKAGELFGYGLGSATEQPTG